MMQLLLGNNGPLEQGENDDFHRHHLSLSASLFSGPPGSCKGNTTIDNAYKIQIIGLSTYSKSIYLN